MVLEHEKYESTTRIVILQGKWYLSIVKTPFFDIGKDKLVTITAILTTEKQQIVCITTIKGVEKYGSYISHVLNSSKEYL